MKQSRRRAFAVTSTLQYRFLGLTLIYGFILVSLIIIAFLVPDVLEMYNESLSLEIRAEAAKRVLGKHEWIWLPLVLVFGGLGLHSFREFQRIAGPLYRFRSAFEQLEKGNLSPSVKIRKKDYLVKEEEAIVKMLASLVAKFSVIKQETGLALKSVGELEGSVGKESAWSTPQSELLRTHRRHLEDLSAAVEFFRLPDESQDAAVLMQEVQNQDTEPIREDKIEPNLLAKGL